MVLEAAGQAGTSSPNSQIANLIDEATEISVIYDLDPYAGTAPVAGQGPVHGVAIGKACATPLCPRQTTDCIVVLSHADGFGDSIEIVEAWDVVDPMGVAVRVPAAGNLAIAAVAGNTTCTVGGALPCMVCGGGADCGGFPSVSNLPGSVGFRQNEFRIPVEGPSPLAMMGNVVVSDRCDVERIGCSRLRNLVQFVAATDIELCCGNSVIEAVETCDGINAIGCQRPCRPPGDPDECTCCGDGEVNGGEDCDDGNTVNDDGCNTKCFFACGDGAVNRPEETCEANDAVLCNAPCRPAGTTDECTCCGDGIVQGSEMCDDGNANDGDGCNSECLVETVFAGCSPDFWKQADRLAYWPQPFAPTDTVREVFGVDVSGNPTLLKALVAEVDAECAFLRQAVAALMNSADPELNYYYTTSQVLALVRVAYNGRRFDYFQALLERQNDMACTLEKPGREGAARSRGTGLSGKAGR